MDAATVTSAEAVGAATVRRLVAAHGCTVVALGEVGIGNTTAAAAVLAALTGAPPVAVVGRGTGVDDAGLAAKAAAIADGLRRHAGVVGAAATAPRGVLAALGGAEVAALVGAIHEAAHLRVAVLVDGVIVSVAALVAVRLQPAAAGCLFLATRSAEAGHGVCVDALAAAIWGAGVPPPHGAPAAALGMGLRLGEATGALLALPPLRAAAAVYTEMATLEEVLAGAGGGGEGEETQLKKKKLGGGARAGGRPAGEVPHPEGKGRQGGPPRPWPPGAPTATLPPPLPCGRTCLLDRRRRRPPPADHPLWAVGWLHHPSNSGGGQPPPRLPLSAPLAGGVGRGGRAGGAS